MDLSDYVSSFSVRGACTCGRCADAPKNPEDKQPNGHTVDIMFFSVANNSAEKEKFLELVQEEHPNWLDGVEHNYLKIGGDMGDQGIALQTMALGKLLGVWELLTPASILPMLTRELQMELAGRGMIAINISKNNVKF